MPSIMGNHRLTAFHLFTCGLRLLGVGGPSIHSRHNQSSKRAAFPKRGHLKSSVNAIPINRPSKPHSMQYSRERHDSGYRHVPYNRADDSPEEGTSPGNGPGKIPVSPVWQIGVNSGQFAECTACKTSAICPPNQPAFCIEHLSQRFASVALSGISLAEQRRESIRETLTIRWPAKSAQPLTFSQR